MKATSLSINLKLPCNAKCPFCISRTTAKRGDDNKKLLASLGRALSYARYHNVDTVLITSSGEPLLGFPVVTKIVSKVREHGIPIIELQTNGTKLLSRPEDVWPLARLDVDLIAISAAAMCPEESATIMHLKDYDYLDAAKAVVDSEKMCRITLNMTRDFQLEKLIDYVDHLVGLGVHQLTLRELGYPPTTNLDDITKPQQAATKSMKWIDENKLEPELEMQVVEHVTRRSAQLWPLPHGGHVYDYRGLGLVYASCMTEPRNSTVRSLILQPDGGLYTSWSYRGSRIL